MGPLGCPDQEGRRGSEEVLPENFGVPLEGDRDVGALCGSHQGCSFKTYSDMQKLKELGGLLYMLKEILQVKK